MSFPGDGSDILPIPEERMPGTDMVQAPAIIADDDLLTAEEVAAQLGAQPMAPEPVYQHDENLAAILATTNPDWLRRQGQEIVEMVEADIQSNEGWKQRFTRGLEILGLSDFAWEDGKSPFNGASTVTHPGVMQAAIQSQARFMEEIFPSAGPVKTLVMGKEDDVKRDTADRVANHMNYQLTIEDEQYFMDTSKLALYLPVYGCAYRKAYHDFVTDKNVLRYLTADEVILPYGAKSAAASPRITHIFKVSENDFRKGVRAKAYRDIELLDDEPPPPNEIEEATDRADDKEEVRADQDTEWKFYETDLALDIPGFEDVNEFGEPTGVALPYTVTLEKESGEIVAIRRNWDERDRLKERETRYAEYWYIPGLGSRGYGLIHIIGGLSDATTDALRALLDSATFVTLQGGFKAKDNGSKAGQIELTPGVWKEVDMTWDELQKSFYTPPFKEPAPALFQLLSFLAKEIERVAGTTELMVGEGDSKAPVGTTIAMIEQGSKVYSGIHKRAHFAAGVEFRMLFKLNARYIPVEGYPYEVPGDEHTVYRKDYDTKIVSVVPVSDPNIFSQTQRIAIAQATYGLARENPQYFKMFDVLKKMMEAFKAPFSDEVMIDPEDVPMQDPVTENIAMSTGRPVKAHDEENHEAHLAVHMSYMQHPQFGGLPQAQEILGPPMMAHIAEHVALLYAKRMRELGVPVPPINMSAQPGESVAGDVPPDASNALAEAAMQMVGGFMQQAGLSIPPDQAKEAEAAKDAEPAPTELDNMEQQSKIAVNVATAIEKVAKAGGTFDQAEAEAANMANDMQAGALPQQRDTAASTPAIPAEEPAPVEPAPGAIPL